ncbi:MAG: hypothetical protein K1X51_14580 [Rhodospirillaceae bacterium]|nr:hypothetical protein [Rhodospirillaceae bacterium]
MSNDDGRGGRSAGLPTRKKKGLAAAARRVTGRLRRLLGQEEADKSVEAKDAVNHFLNAMLGVSARLYPGWQKLLNDSLAECELTFDERRSLFEMHPIDDYFFAAVVALETAKLRGLYTPPEAAELLGEIGAQVDAKAGRTDRVVSDLVFLMLGRIDLGSGMERMKAPYDKAVKTVLQHIGVGKIASTRKLLGDVALRHMLGEPLALGVPQWWKSFKAQFRIYWNEPEPVYLEDHEIAPATAAPAPLRRTLRKRAAAF